LRLAPLDTTVTEPDATTTTLSSLSVSPSSCAVWLLAMLVSRCFGCRCFLNPALTLLGFRASSLLLFDAAFAFPLLLLPLLPLSLTVLLAAAAFGLLLVPPPLTGGLATCWIPSSSLPSLLLLSRICSTFLPILPYSLSLAIPSDRAMSFKNGDGDAVKAQEPPDAATATADGLRVVVVDIQDWAPTQPVLAAALLRYLHDSF
jgi:hypothetical protein